MNSVRRSGHIDTFHPTKIYLTTLLNDIHHGKTKLPNFQQLAPVRRLHHGFACFDWRGRLCRFSDTCRGRCKAGLHLSLPRRSADRGRRDHGPRQYDRGRPAAPDCALSSMLLESSRPRRSGSERCVSALFLRHQQGDFDRELAQRCGYVLGGGCRWKAIGWQP